MVQDSQFLGEAEEKALPELSLAQKGELRAAPARFAPRISPSHPLQPICHHIFGVSSSSPSLPALSPCQES